MTKILIVMLLFIGITTICYAQTSSNDDVLFEKLNTIQRDIGEIKTSNASLLVKNEQSIKEISNDIVSIKIEQTAQATKLNIIWGILGTATGGAGVAFGTYAKKKKQI
jgi:hypothetical protein